MRLRSRRTPTVIALAAAAAIAGAHPAAADEVGTVPADEAAAQLRLGMPDDMTPSAAKTALGELTVHEEGSMDGYDRDEFPHWLDASDHGWPTEPNDACNARNASLYRDGEDVTMSDSCTKLEGKWADPYSAKTFDATGDIDIDHVVPLAAAWRSGADAWTKDRRTEYANDPLVLVSSWDSLNQEKSDQGPDEWKPPLTESHCNYAVRWTFTKDKYDLTVTTQEKSALTGMLETC